MTIPRQRSAARLAPLLPVAALLAFALAGCSDDTQGDTRAADPSPRPTIPAGDEPAAPDEPAEEPTPDPVSSELEPCSLLSASDRRELAVEPGTPDIVGSARTCEWTASGRYVVSVGIFDKLGLDNVHSTSRVRRLRIGSHDAKRLTGGASACGFAMGISDGSRVDAIAAANGDVGRACEVAKRAARLMEPKLP